MRIKRMGQIFTGVGLLVEYLFCDSSLLGLEFLAAAVTIQPPVKIIAGIEYDVAIQTMQFRTRSRKKEAAKEDMSAKKQEKIK